MISGNAIEGKRNWIGVYGYSENNAGIYGESPLFAGFFSGKVYISGQLEASDTKINGELTVTGDLNVHGRSINQLVQKIKGLEEKINELETSRVTRAGMPVRVPATRPSITLTNLSIDHDLNGVFTITGTGFRSNAPLFYRVFNITTNNLVGVVAQNQFDIENLPAVIPSGIIGSHAEPDGTLNTRRELGQFGSPVVAIC